MSAELARLKGLRRAKMADLVQNHGRTNSEAFEACWKLTEQIEEQRAADVRDAAVARDIAALKVTAEEDGLLTVELTPEAAARIREGMVGGFSIGPSLPRPVAAKDHVMFHESKTHPGVVWPL